MPHYPVFHFTFSRLHFLSFQKKTTSTPTPTRLRLFTSPASALLLWRCCSLQNEGSSNPSFSISNFRMEICLLEWRGSFKLYQSTVETVAVNLHNYKQMFHWKMIRLKGHQLDNFILIAERAYGGNI